MNVKGDNLLDSNSSINLFNADCLEIMENVISNNSIDLVLCDLPYGTTQNKWDSVIPLEALWTAYKRVIKTNGVLALTTQIPFSVTVGQSNLLWLKYEWIWEKPQGTGFLNAKRYPLKNHENVLIFCAGVHVYNPQMEPGEPYKLKRKPTASKNYGKCENESEIVNTGFRYPKTVVRFGTEKRGIHPTQKPIALMEYLIKTYTNEGMTVLNNCMGSGTTGVACKRLNRNFIGIEKDETYFKIAENRINETVEDSGL